MTSQPESPPSVGAYLRLINPRDGSDLGTLVGAEGITEQVELNREGALRFTYPTDGINAHLLNQDQALVAVVDHEGQSTDWFALEEDTSNQAEPNPTITVGCRGALALLEYAIVYPQAHQTGQTGGSFSGATPSIAYTDKTAGYIMLNLIQRATARSALPWMAVNFTATTDSAGQPWAGTHSQTFKAGQDLYAIITSLADNGLFDIRMTDRTLNLYRPDEQLNRDLPQAVIRSGREAEAADRKRSRRTVFSHILGVGDEGASYEAGDADVAGRFGRREGYDGHGGITDQAALGQLVKKTLSSTAGLKEGFSLTYSLDGNLSRDGVLFMPPVPGVDFRIGDRVRYDQRRIDDTTLEPLRVRAITRSWAAQGERKCTLSLNDTFVESQVGVQRRIRAIVGNSISTEPPPQPPDVVDATIPATPKGAEGTTEAYLRPDGTHRATVTLTWQAVTLNTNGTPLLDFGEYRVAWRVPVLDQRWSGELATTAETITISDLLPDQYFEARIRALDRGGRWSGQYLYATLHLGADTVAPPRPTAPDVTARLGVVKVEWDGRGDGDVTMPADLAGVDVHMSTAGDFTPYTAAQAQEATQPLRFYNPAAVVSAVMAATTYPQLEAATDPFEAAYGVTVDILTSGGQDPSGVSWVGVTSSDLALVRSNVALLVGEYAEYPPTFLLAISFSRIALGKGIQINGTPQGGAAVNDMFYLDAAVNNEQWWRQNVHHEFLHVVENSTPGWVGSNGWVEQDPAFYTPLQEEWAALNPPGFQYGPEQGQDNLYTGPHPPGFMSSYARNSIREDVAETHSHHMTEIGYELVRDWGNEDPVLAGKIALLRRMLSSINTTMGERDYYQRVSTTALSTPPPVTHIGTLGPQGPDSMVVPGLPYDSVRFFRLVAVDRSGNYSGPTEAKAISVTRLVSTDIIEGAISGANLIDYSIDGTKKVAAGSLDTTRLRVGQANLIVDHLFQDPDIRQVRIPTGLPTKTFVRDSASHNGQWYARISAGDFADFYTDSAVRYPIPANPGQEYRVATWARRTTDYGGPGFQFFVRYLRTDGTFGTDNLDPTRIPAIAWEQLEARWTAPADATYAGVGIINYSPTAGALLYSEPDFRQMTPGVLIQDGAVTAAKVAALAITADKIAANSITADKIDVGAVQAQHIAAEAITASKIGTGTLSATVTISGRIRTALSGARVELDSGGLRAYNAGNLQTFNVSAMNGSVYSVGTFQSGFSSGPYAKLNSDAWHDWPGVQFNLGPVSFAPAYHPAVAVASSGAARPYSLWLISHEQTANSSGRSELILSTGEWDIGSAFGPGGARISGNRDQQRIDFVFAGTIGMRMYEGGRINTPRALEGGSKQVGGNSRGAGMLNSGYNNQSIWFSWDNGLLRLWVDVTNVATITGDGRFL